MAILTNENDLTHIVRTTKQWENTVDKYEVIPEGVLCVEFTPKNKTNIKIGDGHKIFRDLPYVTGIDISKYYNKEETDNRIAEIIDEKKVIRIKGKLGDISELPTSNNIDGDVWFIKLESPTELNSYKEYVWFNNSWELLGNYEDIDISKYATKEDVNKITNRLDDYVANGSIHTHPNKDILDQTNAVFNTTKDVKLTSLHNYDDTELKKWVNERAHTHPNKEILDKTNAVFNTDKDEQLQELEDIPERVQELENVAHSHDNQDVLDRTTAAFTKEQAIKLFELSEGGGVTPFETGLGLVMDDTTDPKVLNVKYGKCLIVNNSNELEVDINEVILNCIPD